MATASGRAGAAIPYLPPERWITYDSGAVFRELVDAKAAVLALKAIPHQRDWLEKLQKIQLKMEVAGTSRIEGADFTENELEAAFGSSLSSSQLITRSQRQARAARETYQWIAGLDDALPISASLIKEVHRRIVTGCDDDHCAPGFLRRQDQNVIFGYPRHRGAEGGLQCERSIEALVNALRTDYKKHDPIIQAVAFHYHFASMHPFLDGNGRTARALEALLLQRAGLRDTAFVAMSNYYYEEKAEYLSALGLVRQQRHDLTPFLQFALRGVRTQCERVSAEITVSVKKAVFRNMMYDLFARLKTPRKRVIAERQIEILKAVLGKELPVSELYYKQIERTYRKLKSPIPAFIRDVNALVHLGAVAVTTRGDKKERDWISANLDWPQEITESDFVERIKSFPKAKAHSFLSFM